MSGDGSEHQPTHIPNQNESSALHPLTETVKAFEVLFVGCIMTTDGQKPYSITFDIVDQAYATRDRLTITILAAREMLQTQRISLDLLFLLEEDFQLLNR